MTELSKVKNIFIEELSINSSSLDRVGRGRKRVWELLSESFPEGIGSYSSLKESGVLDIAANYVDVYELGKVLSDFAENCYKDWTSDYYLEYRAWEDREKKREVFM